MNIESPSPRSRSLAPVVGALLVAALALTSSRLEANENIALWDTSVRAEGPVNPAARADWSEVPTNLFSREANPAKAASDPGYYGRAYSFRGDAVVENRCLTAIFSAAQGRVCFFSKEMPWSGNLGAKVPIQRLAEVSPFPSAKTKARITRCEIIRHAGDEVSLEATFSTAGAADQIVDFHFGRDGIVEIKPTPGASTLHLEAPIAYGVTPSFIGDDLITSPQSEDTASKLYLPAENMFVGLLAGEGGELVLTWPRAGQKLSLNVSTNAQGLRAIGSLDFKPAGQSLFLTGLGAPGIWHHEPLTSKFLEKDVTIGWKRPFSAKWVTQLEESSVPTRFAFRDAKSEVWRGVPGSYEFPVWFNGAETCFRLGKKIPPRGEAIVYFMEGRDTPAGIVTPAEVLQASLGRASARAVLDAPGRRLRSHHRDAGQAIHRACTCGYTEAIQAVFEAGQETERRDYISGAIEDMIYFVQRHVERIEEYQRFAGEMVRLTQSKAESNPALKSYLEPLRQTADNILEEYKVQKENMKSLEYARELTRRTMALTDKKDPKNLSAYMELLKAWRGMGGAQDYVVAQCHTLTRKLHHEAATGALAVPGAVAMAEEIRQHCRQILRTPDGYEIWADY